VVEAARISEWKLRVLEEIEKKAGLLPMGNRPEGRPDPIYQVGSLVSTYCRLFRMRFLMLMTVMLMVFSEHIGRSLRRQRRDQATEKRHHAKKF
jgi:hypothetical protein